MTPFTHLHVHTQYSILDGASSIKSLIKQAQKYEMTSFAITDHGNMYGAKEFHDLMTKAGLKPIIGCEVYVVRDHLVKDSKEKNCHLILLAKNQTGYHNLIKIVSRGWTEGTYYNRPRVDFELISQYHEGLICSSACIAGEIPGAILRSEMDEAEEIIRRYKNLFGEDYYLEMQLHKSQTGFSTDVYQKQLEVNSVLKELAKKYSIKLIATNDSHFTTADDAVAHDHLICLNTGTDLDDPNRLHFTGQEYFKSGDEMAALFDDCPEAIANTMEIADKIETYKLERGPLMPNFPIPDNFPVDFDKAKKSIEQALNKDWDGNAGKLAKLSGCKTLEDLQQFEEYTPASQFQYLESLTYKGVEERYGTKPSKEVLERVEFELSTIGWMGFPGYFLIVWDLLRAAREMGVSVGPGRGSAAGSVVAYCLHITNIDPLKYDLLFERFLNPERISLPDVDMDFDEDGRADVLNYCIQKYGKERVAQIVTFGTMAPKMAIKDVARIQKLNLQESNRLAKLIPDKITPDKDKHETPFEFCYNNCPELKAEKESADPLIQNTLKYAEQLEGTIRQTGVHACGVIIGKDDLDKFAPVAKVKDADLNVVQFEGKLVESVGLIKMDFLGLRTLSIIKDALINIKAHRGINLNIDNIPMDDEKTYELYSAGETTGIFQFESPGMKKHLRNLKPTRFEDLIAMNALYRPGPMDYIPDFIDRKKGLQEIKYDLDGMSDYLQDTYGITVYQEQVMLLSQKLANFTKGQADTLRKAMGKKKRDVLDKMKPQFIEGAKSNGHDEKICEKIWTDWEAFASYAFNKSHATCYAYVSYQTAYLKAHYPAEFMAALLSRHLSDIAKITVFMDECKHMGIKVLGPDINCSATNFSVDKNDNIRFGLGGIKGVGTNAVDAILKERSAKGDFKDIYDFVERVPLQTINRKCIECLTIAGAFDEIWRHSRSVMVTPNKSGNAFIDQLIRYGDMIQTDKKEASNSLFGEDVNMSLIKKPEPEDIVPWTQLTTLKKEKEMVGMFLSGHPLDPYKVIMENMCTNTLEDLARLDQLDGKTVTVGALITEVSQKFTKKDQKPFGIVKIEDYNGQYEFNIFKDWEKSFRGICMPDTSIILKGTVSKNPYRDFYELTNISVFPMNDIMENGLKGICINLDATAVKSDQTGNLSEIIHEHEGKYDLNVKLVNPKENYSVVLSSEYKVDMSREFLEQLEEMGISYSIRSSFGQ